MKSWIGLALAALLLGTIIYWQEITSNPAVVAYTPPPRETLPVAPKPVPHAKKTVFHKPPRRRPVEPTVQAASAPALDLPKWNANPLETSNSMTELKNLKPEDKANRPLVMFTYGDAPKPNFKIEHRELGSYNGASAFGKAPAGAIAAED